MQKSLNGCRESSIREQYTDSSRNEVTIMAADIFSKFKKSMEVKFTQEFGTNQQSTTDITGKTEKFLRLGPTQDVRKAEMIKAGKEIAEKRGIAFYNPMMHTGAPLGQRATVSYTHLRAHE